VKPFESAGESAGRLGKNKTSFAIFDLEDVSCPGSFAIKLRVDVYVDVCAEKGQAVG
jgi:hypothetical protein